MIRIELYNWAEITAAVTCTICLLAKPSVINRWFCWFLWLTVFIEFTSKWAGATMSIKYPLYSIQTGIEYLFYAILFSRIAFTKARKKQIRFCSLIFFSLFILNLAFIQQFKKYPTYTFALEGIFLTFFCLTWYYDVVNAEVQDKFKWSRVILVTAILIFFACTFITFGLINELMKKNPKNIYTLYLRTVQYNVILLYLVYSIVFVLEIFETRILKTRGRSTF